MHLIKSILFFLVTISVTLIISDFFLAKAEIENPGLNELDTIIGRRRSPNLNYSMFTEGFSLGKFNTYSYNGAGYPITKEKHILRIALLGDSYVEGFQLFDRLHFRTIIENKLNESLRDSVQVLNFGRSGFDLADMYVYYKRFVKDFNPDITLFLISNPDLECSQTDYIIPRILSNGNALEIRTVYNKEFLEKDVQMKLFNTLKYSRIIQMANNCRKLVERGFLLPKLLDKLYFSGTDIEIPTNDHDEVEYNEISLLINASLSDDSEGSIWLVNRGKDQLAKDYVSNLEANKIDYIDLNDTLDIIHANGIDYNYWKATKKHGHWNYDAHVAVGTFLANKLIQEINCPTSSK